MITTMISLLNRYLGWRNWAVFLYNSVIENIFLVFYIALCRQLAGFTLFLDVIMLLGLSIFSTSYGYLINDLADRDLDRAQGKPNTFENDSAARAAAVVVLFFLVSIAFGAWFIDRIAFAPLWIIWLLISTGYSLKPLRLKERGKAGLLLVVAAQRVLPTLIIFAVFEHFRVMDLVLFTVYIFFRGLSSDINHQLDDAEQDASTQTSTFAVREGKERTARFLRLSLEMENIFMLFCLIRMYTRLSWMTPAGIPVLLILLFLFALLYVIQWGLRLSGRLDPEANPFRPEKKDLGQFLHHGFPSVVLPLVLVLLLVSKDMGLISLLILLILMKKLFLPQTVTGSYPVRAVMKFFHHK